MSKSGMETTVIRDERGQTIGYVRDFGNIKIVEDQRGQTIGRVRDYGGDHSTLEDVKGQTTGYVDGPHHNTVLFDYFKKNKGQVVHKGLNPLTLALIASAKAVVKKVNDRIEREKVARPHLHAVPDSEQSQPSPEAVHRARELGEKIGIVLTRLRLRPTSCIGLRGGVCGLRSSLQGLPWL